MKFLKSRAVALCLLAVVVCTSTISNAREGLEELARDIQFCNSNNYAVSNKIDRDAREMLDIINTISE